jgi:hypothetical protein
VFISPCMFDLLIYGFNLIFCESVIFIQTNILWRLIWFVYYFLDMVYLYVNNPFWRLKRSFLFFFFYKISSWIKKNWLSLYMCLISNSSISQYTLTFFSFLFFSILQVLKLIEVKDKSRYKDKKNTVMYNTLYVLCSIFFYNSFL